MAASRDGADRYAQRKTRKVMNETQFRDFLTTESITNFDSFFIVGALSTRMVSVLEFEGVTRKFRVHCEEMVFTVKQAW